ncbi:hypothetical protein LCGC14_2390740, partial [marine sediment metagenome]
MTARPLGDLLTSVYDQLSNQIAGGQRRPEQSLLPGADDPLEGSIPDEFLPGVDTFDWFDPRLSARLLYLLANVGVAFDPKDAPAGGWGVSDGGTVGADGDNRLLARFLYLLANIGVAFDPKDAPAGGWGVAEGGT